MTQIVTEAGTPLKFTSTTTINPTGAAVKLLGIFVATTSGGTIALSNGSTAVVSAFTPLAGTFYPLPFEFSSSCVITVVGTLDATASYSV